MNTHEISKIKVHNMGYSPCFFTDLEKLFKFMGSWAEIDSEGLNSFFWEYSWGQIAKSFFKPTVEKTWYTYYEYWDGYDFSFESFFMTIMEHFGFTVLEYTEIEVRCIHRGAGLIDCGKISVIRLILIFLSNILG